MGLRSAAARTGGRGSLPGQVSSSDVTASEPVTANSLKKAKLESVQERRPIPGQLSARAAGTVQTRYRGFDTKSNKRSRRGFQSVDVCHCLPLHCGREA